MYNPNSRPNPLKDAIHQCQKVFIITFMFAFAVNLLMLITPLYSLQVLDRVLGTGSIPTLVNLTIIIVALYLSLHLLQMARSFTLIRVGEWLDKKLSPVLFAQSIEMSAIRPSVGASQNLRDLEAVKSFLTSIGINTLFDAPWSVVYLVAIFWIHPWEGYLTIVGAIVILAFALLNAHATTDMLNKSNEQNIRSLGLSDVAARNAEVVEAMGMMNAVVKHWHKANAGKLDMQSVASYRNGIISNISKFLRAIIQVLVTGIGGYLAVKGEMTAGQMIAASIIVGRALTPFDQAIETWKSITMAEKAYLRITNSFNKEAIREEAMSLPTPEGWLSVESVLFAPPAMGPVTQARYTLKGVSFALEPGDIVAVIGPSAAGKSSLAKLLMGVWKPMSGIVRLDGANVYTWNREQFGKFVGYLPQDVELFTGSVKDNIARMDQDADPEAIVNAAKFTGAHDFILRLPNGYETDIGVGGAALSGGQRQRIGLARAFYGNPKLVVLDEPNASLDELGNQALAQALVNAKARKITTIVISHRPEILANVDKILILQDGVVAAFGPRDEVLARLTQRPAVSGEQQ